jgi:glycosyltransferase involved in cell wall biosynthesis
MVIQANWVALYCLERSNFSSRMRILQLVQKPQRRGAEVFAFHLSRELRRREHHVRTVYLYPYNSQQAGLPAESTDIHLRGKEQSILEFFPGFHFRLLRDLQKVITEFQPDIVQANGSRTVKYGAFAARFVAQRHWAFVYRNIGNPGDWLTGYARKFLYKTMIMSRVDGVVGVSRATLRAVVDFYGLRIPFINIPRGIDTTALVPSIPASVLRQQHDTPVNAPLVLFAGSLTREKRVDRFLRIIQRIGNELRPFHAWIAGDGPIRAEAERLAVEMGLKDTVHFLGIQSDMASLIHACDLLLLTSDTEGIPGVVLEAGFVGIPCVATSVGGVPECVVDNETGMLVDREDEQRFVDKALDLLNNPVKCKEMGASAKKFVAENFEIGNIASRYLDFYAQVLERSQKRSAFSSRKNESPEEAKLKL